MQVDGDGRAVSRRRPGTAVALDGLMCQRRPRETRFVDAPEDGQWLAGVGGRVPPHAPPDDAGFEVTA
jgi:hypothetical protein